MCDELSSGDDLSVHCTPPTLCDICSNPVGEAFYDCQTTLGGWAYLCEQCFPKHGRGDGIGQLFRRSPDGKFRQVHRISRVGQTPPNPGATASPASPPSEPPASPLPPVLPPSNRAKRGLTLAGQVILFTLAITGILAGVPLIFG